MPSKKISELNAATAILGTELVPVVQGGETKKVAVQDLIGNSYSTDETLTGGTWIDGKPIYRKVTEITDFGNDSIFGYLYNSDFKVINVKTLIKSFDQDTYINEHSRQYDAVGSIGGVNLSSNVSMDTNEIYVVYQAYNATTEVWESIFNNNEGLIILEYTKTTD